MTAVAGQWPTTPVTSYFTPQLNGTPVPAEPNEVGDGVFEFYSPQLDKRQFDSVDFQLWDADGPVEGGMRSISRP